MAPPMTLQAGLCHALGLDEHKANLRRVGGGDSHSAACLEQGHERWFIKWNSAARLGEFKAELDALSRLAVDSGPTLPSPVDVGIHEEFAWLAIEWLDLQSHGDAVAFGQRLAALHRHSRDQYGWHETNFLGASPQHNDPSDSWPEFWWYRRLEPQLQRALASGLELSVDLSTLQAASDQLLGHDLRPALVHGDLWSGNHAYLPNGAPAFFDPAPYYGDRETDLAMMRLFGGFDPAVLEAYEVAWPLPKGHQQRVALYQSYHLLNHYNLFGSGWAARVKHALHQVVQAAETA